MNKYKSVSLYIIEYVQSVSHQSNGDENVGNEENEENEKSATSMKRHFGVECHDHFGGCTV